MEIGRKEREIGRWRDGDRKEERRRSKGREKEIDRWRVGDRKEERRR